MFLTKVLDYMLTGGGAIALARGVWYAWMQWRSYRDTRAGKKALEGRGEVREALRDLRYATSANYVQVIRIHNGGGELKAGLEMYMSCVHEEKDDDLAGLKDRLQGIEIDEQYFDLLTQLIEMGDAHAAVDEVGDPLLRDLYSLMKSRYLRSAVIRVRRDGIYLLRCSSSTAPMGGEGNQFNIHFRRALARLKKHY